jgi:SOS-response transcriptional repressor LexA
MDPLDLAVVLSRKDLTSYRVNGNQLAKDGIHDGDYVLADPDGPVYAGDIAVIERDSGIVIRRVSAGERLVVLGKAVAVLHRTRQ